MKRDTWMLGTLIVVCLYFGIHITLSPAPLWLIIPVDVAFVLIALACTDAILAIRYNDRRDK